jgi:glycosyltransferase involved in cell wall biosynthesis
VPTVSVVVPCYKYGRYVTECVTSVLANSTVDLDILVIDDASPDDSWNVVQQLPQLDPRIRIQRNEQNRGLIATANSGVLAAKGEYVVLLSADDALAPGWLDRGVALLEAHPRAALAYGLALRFSDQVPQVRAQRGDRPVEHSGVDFIRSTCARGLNGIICPEAIVRTSAQVEVGGYRADLPYSSDMEMWLRLATIGNVVQDRGDYAAFFRVSPQSMSAVAESSLVDKLRIRRDAFNAWHEYARELLPEADDLLAQAYHALARTAVRRAYLAFTGDPRGQTEAAALGRLALELDPAWSTRPVRALDVLGRNPLARTAMRAASPLSRISFRGYQASKVAWRRLTRSTVT